MTHLHATLADLGDLIDRITQTLAKVEGPLAEAARKDMRRIREKCVTIIIQSSQQQVQRSIDAVLAQAVFALSEAERERDVYAALLAEYRSPPSCDGFGARTAWVNDFKARVAAALEQHGADST